MSYSFDTPIEFEEDDLLSRQPLVNRLHHAIRGLVGRGSFVIGLDGAWGAGKTSLISLLKLRLQKDGRKNQFRVFEFNPWSYSKSDDLPRVFFEELGRELGIVGDYELWEQRLRKIRIVEEFGLLAKWSFFLLKWVPVALSGYIALLLSGVLSSLPFTLSEAAMLIPALLLSLMPVLAGRIVRILSAYSEGQKIVPRLLRAYIEKAVTHEKILIILDDLDRLTADELLEMLKIVKNNANFSNTVFLLAGDFGRMARCLDGLFPTEGEQFIKKIVQKTVRCPEPTNHELTRIAKAKLSEFLGEREGETLSIEDREFVVWMGENVFPLLQNLRDLFRFMNDFRFSSGLFLDSKQPEVDRRDVSGLIMLHSIEREVVNFLIANKTNLVSFEPALLRPETLNETEKEANHKKFKEELERLIAGRGRLRKLMEALFPRIRFFESQASFYAIKMDRTEDRERRICSSIHFDTYFRLLDDESNSLSLGELLDFLNECYAGNGISELTTILANDRLRPLLNAAKIYVAYPEYVSVELLEPAMLALLNVSEQFPERYSGQSVIDTPTSDLLSILCSLGLRLDLEGKMELFFMNLLCKTEGISIPLLLIGDDEQGTFDCGLDTIERSRLLQRFEQRLLNEKERIEASRTVGKILYYWKLGKGKGWKEILDSLLSSSDGILNLLHSLFGPTISTIALHNELGARQAIALLPKREWLARISAQLGKDKKIDQYYSFFDRISDEFSDRIEREWAEKD